jgi:hypothetical protein
MSVAQDIRQLKTGPAELRKFGLSVGSVFLVLGLLYWLRHKPWFPWFVIPGLLLIALGLTVPRILKYIYIGWMSVAFVLGFVVSNLVLMLFFFLVITPIGIVARCAGSDFLKLKLDPGAETYWIYRERKTRKPEDYERQF